MKYIRTKDGVFELCEKQKYEEQWQVRVNGFLTGYRVVNKDRVIKSADTIEELCDEYVLIGQDGIPLLLDLEECLDRVEDLGLTKYTICSAIWTNKGLIYVAKMNEEGELELL